MIDQTAYLVSMLVGTALGTILIVNLPGYSLEITLISIYIAMKARRIHKRRQGKRYAKLVKKHETMIEDTFRQLRDEL